MSYLTRFLVTLHLGSLLCVASAVDFNNTTSARGSSDTCEVCPPPELLRPCRCVEHRSGDFFQTMLSCNSTDFKYERNFEHILTRISKRLSSGRSKYFDWLYLSNMDGVRKLSRHFFAGLQFRHLVIEDAPHLKLIHPGALKQVTHQLRYVYAYNTGLEQYRRAPSKAPFSAMRNLTEVHIASKRNICPPKELISPCDCRIRQNPLLPFHIKRQVLQLRCLSRSGKPYNVTRIFNRLTKLMKNNRQSATWHFDEIVLRDVRELGPKAFGEIDFSELHVEHSDELRWIARDAFPSNATLQKVRISGANFTSDRLAETFEALNRLRYLRSLYIWSCTLDFVPEYAFSGSQPFLKEIVLYGNNLRAIGSYAFASLASLDQLRIDGNNLILLDKYAFATNYSSEEPLHLTLVANNLRESSFAFMALNGAQRPLHLSFAEHGGCYWEMQYLDESVFAPFLDKSDNRLYLEPECQLKCDDCRMRWLTEIPKHAQHRVTRLELSNYRPHDELLNGTEPVGYVPCEGGANLFDVSDSTDWEHCN